MAGRLRKGRSQYDLILFSDQEYPIYLKFDRTRKPFGIQVRYVPNLPGSQGSIQIQEWTWKPGKAGAGHGIETAGSYEAGGSDYGRNVWLRKLGVAQPAGALTEVNLPAGTAALTSGSFTEGLQFGSGEDFFITTRSRYVVKVAGGTGALTEHDCGSGSETVGITSFDQKLYVGDPRAGIQEYDGSTWTEGAAGTEREWLLTLYWVIGDNLATGGLSGGGGGSGYRLLGTRADGTGFYVVSDDPKVSANWNALTVVGASASTILKMVGSNTTAWFGKSDGIHGVNELGYGPNLTEWVSKVASTNNFRALAYWNGMIWGATEQGLMTFTPNGDRIDLGQYVQFGAGASNTSPIWGRPRALNVSPEGLYAGYYNNTDSYVGLLKLDPDGSYRWSMAEAVIEGEQITFIHQTSPGGIPRLWLGSLDDDGRLHLRWQSQPITGDPDLDAQHGGPFVPAADWSVRLSQFDGGTPVQKTVRRFMLTTKRLGDDYPDNTVDVRVSADNGAFVTQGTATESPRWSSAPQSSLVRAVMLQLELVVHNASNAPVMIYSAGVRYSPHPELTKVTTYPVLFGEKVTGQDPKVVLARLETAQNSGPFMHIDQLGREIEGTIEPGINELFTEEADPKGWTVHADVTISTTRVPAQFDIAQFGIDTFS